MSIRILGMNASPRDNSNSLALLDASFKAVSEKYPGQIDGEIISLRDYDIKPCLACNVCGKKKDGSEAYIPCVQVDKDQAQIILDKMVEADGIAVATPVYFGLPTDLFVKFIMRTRTLRHQDFRLADKPVGIMSIAARRSGGGETTILATWLPFIRNGCLIVGNGNATSQFGAVGWAGPRGHILSDDWALEQGMQVVERIYHVARLIKAGAETLGYSNPMRFCYKSGTRPVE